MDEFEINLKLSETPTSSQIKKLEKYFKDFPLLEILSGLKKSCNIDPNSSSSSIMSMFAIFSIFLFFITIFLLLVLAYIS